MNKKIFIMFSLIVAVLIFFSVKVNAMGSTVSITSGADGKESIVPGEKFTVTVNVKDTDGIGALQGTFEYDEDVFEITENEIDSNWQDLGESFPNIAIGIKSSSSEDLNEATMYKLTVKVKESASNGSTSIKFKNIVVTDVGDNDTDVEEIEKNYTIKKEETDTPSSGDVNAGNSGSSASSDNKKDTQVIDATQGTSKSSSKSNTSGNSIKTSKATKGSNENSSLPYTGTKENIGIFLALLGIVAFGYTSYKLYNKYKKI